MKKRKVGYIIILFFLVGLAIIFNDMATNSRYYVNVDIKGQPNLASTVFNIAGSDSTTDYTILSGGNVIVHCNLTEAIALSIELMGKRYLYPAIISACRNLDELDVYLDCLEKNELDDFKIFKIKYELHPLVIKQENDLFIKTNYWTTMKDFFRKIIFKNYKTKVGKRYKN